MFKVLLFCILLFEISMSAIPLFAESLLSLRVSELAESALSPQFAAAAISSSSSINPLFSSALSSFSLACSAFFSASSLFLAARSALSRSLRTLSSTSLRIAASSDFDLVVSTMRSGWYRIDDNARTSGTIFTSRNPALLIMTL